MIPETEPSLNGKELEYVTDAIKSEWISHGKYVSMFEEKFSEFCNVKYGVSCNTGTSALHLALMALGIKNDDEVILPTSTYIATANVIKYVKATPIFVDSNKETWNLDPIKIEEKITNKTKAIIPVHLYGVPCDMDKIIEIARKYNLYVIEDCAEAHGAEYKGKKVGGFGDIGCFSFFANKIITTGEGGMCVTNNKELKEKIEILKNQGMSKKRKGWYEIIGFNYRMTNLQAALGLAQLEQIKNFLGKREVIFKTYKKFLRDVKGVELPPESTKGSKQVNWMYTILSDKKENIISEMKKEGIGTRPFFIPLHKMPPYNIGESYPIAEKLYTRGISLPSSVKLKEDEIKKICEIIQKVAEK